MTRLAWGVLCGGLLWIGTGCSEIESVGCDPAIDHAVMVELLHGGVGVDSNSFMCASNASVGPHITAIRQRVRTANLDRCERAAYDHWLDYFAGKLTRDEASCAADAHNRDYQATHPLTLKLRE